MKLHRATFFCILATLACSRGYEASFCAVVAAYDTHTDDLIGRFDNFANSLNLEIDGSHPSSRSYSSPERDYEITVTTHSPYESHEVVNWSVQSTIKTGTVVILAVRVQYAKAVIDERLSFRKADGMQLIGHTILSLTPTTDPNSTAI